MKTGATADSVWAQRGTSAGQIESARAQDEANRQEAMERSDTKNRSEANRTNTPQEFERSGASRSNRLSGPTKEGRRADYWRASRGAEQVRARRWLDRRATGGDYYLPGARHDRRTGSSLRRERIGPCRGRASIPLCVNKKAGAIRISPFRGSDCQFRVL